MCIGVAQMGEGALQQGSSLWLPAGESGARDWRALPSPGQAGIGAGQRCKRSNTINRRLLQKR